MVTFGSASIQATPVFLGVQHSKSLSQPFFGANDSVVTIPEYYTSEVELKSRLIGALGELEKLTSYGGLPIDGAALVGKLTRDMLKTSPSPVEYSIRERTLLRLAFPEAAALRKKPDAMYNMLRRALLEFALHKLEADAPDAYAELRDTISDGPDFAHPGRDFQYWLARKVEDEQFSLHGTFPSISEDTSDALRQVGLMHPTEKRLTFYDEDLVRYFRAEFEHRNRTGRVSIDA